MTQSVLGLMMLRGALVAYLCAGIPLQAGADEVDDLLALRAKNAARINRFSAEYITETTLPTPVKGQSVVRMRYRTTMERLKNGPAAQSPFPWRAEIETFEPMPMAIRIDGDEYSMRGPDGNWKAVELEETQRKQIKEMAGSFAGENPADLRRNASLRILRNSNPIFGPRTITLETTPRTGKPPFARMEEDIRTDGLAIRSRVFDLHGQSLVTIRVLDDRKVNGIPFMQAMESISDSPTGRTVRTTRCVRMSCE